MNQSLGLGSDESLLPASGGSSWNDLQDIESHGFRQGPALANDDMVAFLDTEAGGDVSWDVGVPLLIPLILLD